MVTFKFKAVILIILSFTVILLPACSEKDGSGYLFRYSLLSDPKILDPQLATDISSLEVIDNMFCGLLRTTSSGKLTEGVATDYSISDDGLTYNFSLSDDFYWESEAFDEKIHVTANDFVFAFQRIFDKSTKSPYTADFSCIKNAENIIAGTLQEDSIGVKANGDFNLIIELDYPNANFLSLLTTSPSMPCNKAFFESTKGKYGLDTEASISNGAFYLKQWEYDPYGQNNYLIMRRNEYFADVYQVYPSSLNYFIEKDTDVIESDFLSGSTDCIVTDGTNKKIMNGGYTVDKYETISTGLIFNTNSEVFSNKSFREALSLSIDRSSYKNNLSNSAESAYGIVPAGITMLNKSYRELVSESDKSSYNKVQAREEWSKGLAGTGKITVEGIKILVPQSFINSDWLKYINQQWQNELEFFCGIEIVPDDEYYSRISEGDYEIALYQLSCTYNSPEAVLNNFMPDNQNNIMRYNNPALTEILEKSGKVQNLSDCVEYYSEAEKLVIDDYVYIPLFYQKEFFVYADTIKDIKYNPFTKQINFSDAKNFK